MKPTIWIASAAVFLAIGCGSKTVYKDDQGNEVTVSEDGDSIKVKSSDGGGEMKLDESGKFEIRDDEGNVISGGTAPVTEEQLGVKIYPGSKEMTGSSTSRSDGITSYISIRSTTDPPAKVHEFYKSLLGAPASSVSANDSYMDMWEKGGRAITITIARTGGKTEITITSTTKK